MVGSTKLEDIRVPDRPSDLGLSVPGDSWRPQQPFAIAHALKAFLVDGKRFWLFNGATGSGKSIIAAAIGRLLEGPTTFLTHTIQLQQQYLQTMEEAVTATGKRNHACLEGGLLGQQLTADDCDSCQRTGRKDPCPYYGQFHQAADSPERVLNYAYGCRVNQGSHIRSLCKDRMGEDGVSVPCSGCNPFSNGKMLVCDEGHLAEGAVVEAVKTEMVERTFREEGFPFPHSRLLYDWIDWAAENVERAANHASESRAWYYSNQNQATLRTWRRARAIATAMESLSGVDPDNTNAVLTLEGSIDKATQRPIWGWDDAKRALFGRFPHVILMSATLGDPAILVRKLGVAPDQCSYLDLPSPFPVEHRKVWRWPVAGLGRKAEPAAWRIAMEATDSIIGKFPNRKGLIHTASHNLTKMIVEQSQHRGRLIFHDSSGRMEALEQYKKEQRPSVLVSASFATGLDLPGIIGFQVIPKVPFPGLGDEVTRLRFEWGDEGDRFGKKNYADETMNTIVQASGRGVRTERDVCPTFILDRNFNHLSKQAFMPQSFRDALDWLEGRGA